MKLLLTFGLVLFCTAAFSQTYKRYQPNVTPKYPLYRYDLKDRLKMPGHDSLPGFENLAVPYKLEGGIFFLPQDNMPCVVPPAVSMGQIPNRWRWSDNNFIWLMPNLAEPFRIK